MIISQLHVYIYLPVRSSSHIFSPLKLAHCSVLSNSVAQWLELHCSPFLCSCCALHWPAAQMQPGRQLGSTSSRTGRGTSPSRSPTGEPPSCLSLYLTPKAWFHCFHRIHLRNVVFCCKAVNLNKSVYFIVVGDLADVVLGYDNLAQYEVSSQISVLNS